MAEKVDGGFRVTSRKLFVSGAPAGDLLLTSAVYQDPVEGPTVLHIPVPMNAPGVKVHDNWRTLGMRATGSHDVTIEGVVVPEAAVALRRPKGRWHPVFDVLNPVVWPLVGAVYAGVAEQARALAVAQAARRRDDPAVQAAMGELDMQLTAVRLAHAELMALCNDYDFEPTLDRANRVFLVRTLLGRACLATLDKAIEVTGGGSFFRSAGIERLFRDVQAVRFHPLPEKRAALFTGRVALGLEPV